ncbi:MurR/RpiR family transcriptional regulator [Salisediminibacterium beveridgei]|uniref:Sialic acid utilization regulator, RpiR family n=1 Tax=Salisediminibacterium beveridgei TaxID=632773 RepID=A0A1D7QZP9_9BACI|nr:MurR/RpiR family transcriptional regulator [Salisediminibacterium beveridgei]AOM84491.1 Sialic acid utilization regulator, RpiR family [Salisediminibacterium beveridgei]
MSVNGGILMLSEMLPTLPPSEKKIAMYIISNPQETVSLTAKELGKRSLTSGAAVIRLCKSLNLKGFQDLKIRIAGDLQRTDSGTIRDIEPNESPVSIIEKMTNNSIQTIKETAELLNIEELEKAIEMIRKTSRVHFVGLGASGIIAQDAQQKFLRINKNAYAFTDIHMVATQVANADENDVVVGISYSGGTAEVAKVLQLARQRNIKTISITKYGNNIVSDHADVHLYTSTTKEPTFRSGATSSRIAQLQVVDILFMCVASNLYDETVKHLDETRKAVEFLTSSNKKPEKRNGADD